MRALDLVIVAAFLVYAVVSGLRARRRAAESLEEYFLAGRSLPGWKAGISMAATQFAADTPLLVTGLIATAGIFSLWRLWIYALSFLLMGFVLAPSWRKAGVLTDAELSELRYGSRAAALLRGVKAVYFGTVFNCAVLAMVLYAAKEIAEPFLPWNQWLPAGAFAPLRHLVEAVGVPFAREAVDPASVWVRSTNNFISIGVLVFVTTLYSTTGGLRAVVETDVFQFALMMLGTIIFAVFVVQRAGGLDGIRASIEQRFAAGGDTGLLPSQILAFTPSRAKDASWVLLAVFALQWLVQMNADGTGYLAQRSMACRSDRDARMAALVFTVAQVLVRSLVWLPIGLGLLVVFPPSAGLSVEAMKASREASYVLGMKELLPSGALGLMLTGMLAALASTVDTHLNWGASYWTNDLYARFVCRSWRKVEPSPRELVWVARLSNLVILLIALGVMTRLGSIQTAWHATLLLGAGMGVLLVLRWIWWRITAWGEIAAIGASFVLAPVLLRWVPGEAARLLIMAAGSTLAGVAVSLAFGPEPEERLRTFYARAAPPGFWGPVARASGRDPADDARRLARGLATVAVSALSIFSLLTGLGSWLSGSPAPTWIPWRGPWLVGVTAVGLALVPVWWRLGFSGPHRSGSGPQMAARTSEMSSSRRSDP